MDSESIGDVTPSQRIQGLIFHAEKQKARRHIQDDLWDAESIISNLQHENETLRAKLRKALHLLSIYKIRTETRISDMKHFGDVSPISKSEEVRRVEDSSPVTQSKRSLLSRYLELGNQKKIENDDQNQSVSKERVTKMWRDRLLKHRSRSPDKVYQEETHNSDVLDLAKQLNSGEVRIGKKQPQVDVEEISLLLSRKL